MHNLIYDRKTSEMFTLTCGKLNVVDKQYKYTVRNFQTTASDGKSYKVLPGVR
ncbi:MAG: hypothetical protein NTV01_13695 [Bacteroidia bacterium]|nr:hypothetical protein [Bacteroidia bacterium]